jgi:hypothetical protein
VYYKYDVRLIIIKLERLFLVEYIIGIIVLILFLNWFYKDRKESEEIKQGVRSIDHAKEVAQAHGYILEQIGETFSGRSPLVELRKEINSDLHRPYEVKLQLDRSVCLVSCTGPTYSGVVFDNIGYPLSGDDLKDIEEKVVDGSHFLHRDQYGHKIRPKIS